MWYIPLLLSILAGGLATFWQYSIRDEYLCQVEFVPPHMDELGTYYPFPRVAPGKPSDLERMQSYLQSPTLLQQVVDSFRLIAHYRLDHITDPKVLSRALSGALEQHIVSRITRNSTILLEVYDEDPSYAYRIASYLLQSAKNHVNFYIRREESLQELRRQQAMLDTQIDSFLKRIQFLRTTYKIVGSPDLETGNFQVPYQMLLRNPEALAHYDELMSLEVQLRRLSHLRIELQKLRIDREYFLNSYPELVWEITRPAQPTVPARPRRLRWIVLSIGITFITSSLLILYAYHLGLLQATLSTQPTPYVPTSA